MTTPAAAAAPPAAPPGATRVVVALGTAQTLAWASSYYLPAVLAAPMARDLGLSPSWVVGACSAALVLSALLGPAVGRAIDARGGRGVLALSNLVLAAGLALLAAETVVLLTLALLLSSVVSTMASGIVAVGLFGATWIAGVVGGLGAALGNEGVERVGAVSRVLLPTDGLWRGAMNAFQDPIALPQMGAGEAGFPFLADAPLTPAYLAWAVVWVAVVWGLTALSFQRRDV